LPPTEALIGDVPFVGFADAARIAYPDKEVVNPSLVAAAAMLAGTGDPAYRPSSLPPPVPRRRMAVSVVDIKLAIAYGSPVFVLLPPAPDCHFLLPSVTHLLDAVRPGLLRGLDDKDTSSGMLGRMASSAAFQDIRTVFGLEQVTDIVQDVTTAAAAVVVGYRDDKQVFLIHDPSCGPATEIDATVFEAGWRLCGSSFGVLLRPGVSSRPRNGNTNPRPYRPRTASERAAQIYRMAYAAAATGQPDLASGTLETARELGGLPAGYRHLMHLERAAVLRCQGKLGLAVGEIEKAVALHDANPIAWALALRIRDERKGPGDQGVGEVARDAMVRCWNDHEGLRQLGRFLPSDFWIPILSTDRGWAGERT